MTGQALPDNFALVAACCRWPPSPASDEAVRAAAAKVTDWERVLRLSARHRVEGLVHAALRSADVALPPDTMAALAAGAQRIAFRNGVLSDESARLQAAFDMVQIPAMILKGSALAHVARSYGLTPKESFAAGDSHNDFEMLHPDNAAMIACPSNAVEEIREHVKAHGGYLAKAARGHGTIEALKHYFFKS